LNAPLARKMAFASVNRRPARKTEVRYASVLRSLRRRCACQSQSALCLCYYRSRKGEWGRTRAFSVELTFASRTIWKSRGYKVVSFLSRTRANGLSAFSGREDLDCMPGPCIEEDERDGKEEKGELNLDDLTVLCETLLSLLLLLIFRLEGVGVECSMCIGRP